MRFLGLDLAGKEKNPTGFALLSKRSFSTGLIYRNEEIIELCSKKSPRVIAIDAPLSLPKRGGFREADTLLIRRGYRVLPPTLGPMRALTERAIHLSDQLRGQGFKVIEIHPRTSGKIMFGTQERRVWLSVLKRHGWQVSEQMNEHEADAVAAALTAKLYWEGKAEEVGKSPEAIIIPRAPLKSREPV